MTLFAAIRCPHCGTYRLVGDAPCDCRTKLPPVIIGDGDIDDQVRYAIRCVCGEDRVILKVERHEYPLRSEFPEGTKHFVVTSESSTCECESPCQWMDRVFWYRDRSVVIKQSEMHTTLLGNVIQQLRGE
jgi:hypothetical protein